MSPPTSAHRHQLQLLPLLLLPMVVGDLAAMEAAEATTTTTTIEEETVAVAVVEEETTVEEEETEVAVAVASPSMAPLPLLAPSRRSALQTRLDSWPPKITAASTTWWWRVPTPLSPCRPLSRSGSPATSSTRSAGLDSPPPPPSRLKLGPSPSPAATWWLLQRQGLVRPVASSYRVCFTSRRQGRTLDRDPPSLSWLPPASLPSRSRPRQTSLGSPLASGIRRSSLPTLSSPLLSLYLHGVVCV